MRIAVDVDGVLYNWESAARYMLREYRDCTKLDEPSTGWNYIQDRVSPEDWDWLWSEGVKRGLYRYGHGVTGAIIGMRQLSELEHKLLVVTHRPRSAVRDTIDWLSYMHLPLSEVHILSDGQPKSSISADILIDDKVANIEEWEWAGRKAILFTQPWNRDYIARRRAANWKGVVANVERIRSSGTGGNRNSVLEDAQAAYHRWRSKAESWDKGVLEEGYRA